MTTFVRWGLRLVILLGGVTAIACSDNGSEPVIPENVYMTLRLNHHGINLSTSAPSNTVQLNVEARTGNGTVLPISNGVTYESMDETVIKVTTDGLMTAYAPGFLIGVVASARIGDVTHTDTAWVTVTDAPITPEVDSFVVGPPEGDSARQSSDSFLHITAFGYDANGDPIEQWMMDGAAYHYESSDPLIAYVDPLFGNVTFHMPGTVKFFVQTYLYGKALTDTFEVVVTDPLSVEIAILSRIVTGQPETNYFTPPKIAISRGGVVRWQNRSQVNADIVFENPSAATEAEEGQGSGNIPVLLPDSSALRRFVNPGTYTYKSMASGSTGTIIVK